MTKVEIMCLLSYLGGNMSEITETLESPLSVRKGVINKVNIQFHVRMWFDSGYLHDKPC